MPGGAFFEGARRLLVRLLLALLLALAVAVFARQFTDGSVTPAAPIAGRDHWHAAYQVFICGERQPNFPTWRGGVHTHVDGIIHIHPFLPSEQGQGARLVKWFEYGGGKLTQTEMRMPGSRETFKNGDSCPNGSQGVLQVLVNGETMEGWSDYIPKDGDRVLIVFGGAEAD